MLLYAIMMWLIDLCMYSYIHYAAVVLAISMQMYEMHVQ